MRPPPPSSSLKELVRLYSLAQRGEYNLSAHLRSHPELVAALGLGDNLDTDDAELGLALAPAIGRFKRACSSSAVIGRQSRADEAARELVASARHDGDRVVLETGLLLGGVSTANHDYIGFALETVRVAVPRRPLVRARVALRGFLDLASFVDLRGLHFRWRAGRGGLNLRAQLPRRDERLLLLDLRGRPALRPPTPLLLAEVLAELGLT